MAEHLGLVAHVGLHRHGGAAARANFAHHLVGGQRVAGVVDGHRVAALRGEQGGGGANAAPAARDQEHLVQNLPPAEKLRVS
jgi:hypothetical protein